MNDYQGTENTSKPFQKTVIDSQSYLHSKIFFSWDSCELSTIHVDNSGVMNMGSKPLSTTLSGVIYRVMNIYYYYYLLKRIREK